MEQRRRAEWEEVGKWGWGGVTCKPLEGGAGRVREERGRGGAGRLDERWQLTSSDRRHDERPQRRLCSRCYFLGGNGLQLPSTRNNQTPLHSLINTPLQPAAETRALVSKRPDHRIYLVEE